MYEFFEKNLNTILRNNFRARSKNPTKELTLSRSIGKSVFRIWCRYDDVHITVHSRKTKETMIVSVKEHSDFMYIYYSHGIKLSGDYVPFVLNLDNLSSILTDEGYFQHSLIVNMILSRDELQCINDLVMAVRDKSYKRYDITEQEMDEVK